MGVTRAFGRLVRNILHVITFGLVKLSEPIESNPQIVGLQYDEVIHEKARTAQRIKNAIGGLIAQQTEAENKLKQITGEIEELEEVKAGSEALAKERAGKLRAEKLGDETLLKDGEILQYQAAFADASSTIAEKRARAQDLEEQIKSLGESVNHYVVEAQELAREVERLRAEKHETVASMEAARQIEQMNEALAGIATKGADETLSRLRRRRSEAEGRAKAAMKVAETDATTQRRSLREAARRSVQSKEFMEALGIGQPQGEAAEKEAPQPAPPRQEPKLPE